MTVVRNKGYHYPDYDGDNYGDHKVAADSTDNAAGGEDYLLAKMTSGTNSTPALDTSSGRRVRINVTASSLEPQPVGEISDAGSTGQLSDAGHVHAYTPPDPEVEGSKLYPCYVYGGSWAQCHVVFNDYFLRDNTLWYDNGWTRSGDVWTKDNVGDISSFSVWFDGVLPYVGMRFFAPCIGCDWSYNAGIYVLTDLGSESTHATFERVSDANESSEFVVGKRVFVSGGLTYANHVFQYDGPASPTIYTDLLLFSDQGIVTPPAGDTYNLLTQAQVVSGGATTSGVEAEATRTTGKGYFSSSFVTILGTPGVSEIPASTWTAQALDVYVDSLGDDDVTFGWDIFKSDDLVTPILSIESAPVSETASTITFQAVLTDAYTDMDEDTLLIAWPFINNASSTEATLHYKHSSWSTWIKGPFSFPVSGVTDHQQLSGRDGDVADGDDPRHPLCALGPGRLHTTFSETSAVLDNSAITWPPDSNSATVAGGSGSAINGIISAGWLPGDILYLTITGSAYNSLTYLNHNVEPPPTDSLPLYLQAKPTAGSPTFPIMQISTPNARLMFQLNEAGTHFQLMGYVP